MARRIVCRCRSRPSSPIHAMSAAYSRSSLRSKQPPPTARHVGPHGPEPSAPHGSGPQERICSSSCLSWLHLLKSWSLRQSRGGSKPFSRWDRHPPFPPSEFVEAARDQIYSTARSLQALGLKPRRPQVRAILKSCVEWFNAKDLEFGNVIETEEREDICAVLEELAFVARQGALVSEI